MSIYDTYFSDTTKFESDCHLKEAHIQVCKNIIREYNSLGEPVEEHQKSRTIRIDGIREIFDKVAALTYEITGDFEITCTVNEVYVNSKS